jgi:hypothetical protein
MESSGLILPSTAISITIQDVSGPIAGRVIPGSKPAVLAREYNSR